MRIQERHGVQALPVPVFVVDAAAVAAAPGEFVEAVDFFAAVGGAVVPRVAGHVEVVAAFGPDLVQAVAGRLCPRGQVFTSLGGGGESREQHEKERCPEFGGHCG
ncbi:hypothetical protein D3C85_1614150 [compost metagenome]